MRKMSHLLLNYRNSLWITLLLLISISVHQVGSEQSRVIYIHHSVQYTLSCQVPAENVIKEAGLQVNETATTWYREGVKINDDHEYTIIGADLKIREFTANYVGVYHCMTLLLPYYTEPHLIISPQYRLLLADESIVVFPLSQITLYEGRSMLTCPVDGFLPPVPSYNVTWYRDGVKLNISDTNRYMQLPDGKLYFLNLTRDDNFTVWSCSVRTLIKTISSVNNITINVLPYKSDNLSTINDLLDVPPSHIQVDDTTSEVIIPCFSRESNQYLSWLVADSDGIYENLTEYDWSKLSRHDHYLNLTSIIFQNSRTIRTKCVGTFNGNYKVYNTTISKHFAPKIYTQPTFNSVDISRKTTLKCKVPSRAHAKFAWYKDGKPVLPCHKRVVNADDSLTLEYVSVNDSGVYQCKYENQFGQAINTHIVKASIVPSVRDSGLQLKITNARMISENDIVLEWSTCTRNLSTVLAFTFNIWGTRCQHNVRIISEVKSYTQTDCIASNVADHSLSCSQQSHTSGNECVCCKANIEVFVHENGSITEIMAFTTEGAQLSNIYSTNSKEYYIAKSPQTTNLPQSHDMNVRVYDFGSALVVTWDRVQSASGYHLSVGGVFQEGNILPKYLSIQQSPDLNFTIITDEHLRRLSPDSQITITPITAVKSKPVSVKLTRDRNITGKPPYILTMVPSTHSKDLSVFWNWDRVGSVNLTENAEPHKYLLWYICDGNEGLIWFNASSTKATIRNKKHPVTCEIYLGVFNSDGETLRGVFTRYDRWCRRIIPPHNITISPEFNIQSVSVHWLPDYNNLSCEVDYIIKWRRKRSMYFYEDDEIIVRNVNFAVIPNLQADVRYEIQIIAYTNDTVQHHLSAVHYYTAGAPFPVRKLSINQTQMKSGSVSVYWRNPPGEHSISLYVLTLYNRTDSHWMRVISRTALSADSGVLFKSLSPRTWYNITVQALNGHGAGDASSVIFKTPTCTTYPHCVTKQPLSSSLTDVQLGVIIGLVAAAFFAFIAALICIIFRRRWKPIRRPARHGTPLINLERQPMMNHYMESASGYSGETTRRILNSDSMLTVTSTSAREDNSEEVPLRSVKKHTTEGVDSGIADWDKPTDSLSLTFSNEDDELSLTADTPTDSATYPYPIFLQSGENNNMNRFTTQHDPD